MTERACRGRTGISKGWLLLLLAVGVMPQVAGAQAQRTPVPVRGGPGRAAPPRGINLVPPPVGIEYAVQGLVLTAEGDPATGAGVHIVLPYSPSGPVRLAGSTAAVVTDGQGRFHFAQLREHAYLVVASDGSGGRAVAYADAESRELTLQLVACASLRGRVTDAAGTGVVAGIVAVRRDQQTRLADMASASSNDDGSFSLGSLTPGVWRIEATQAELGSNLVEVTVPARGEAETEIVFPPTATVTGRVVGLSQQQLDSTVVLVGNGVLPPSGLQVTPPGRGIVPRRPPALTVAPARDGTFRFTGLPLGEHLVSARTRLTDRPEPSERVFLVRDRQTVEVELLFSEAIAITGTVHRAGHGVPDLPVVILGHGTGPMAVGLQTDRDGQFGRANLAQGDYTVIVSDPWKNEIARREVERLDGEVHLDIELPPRSLVGQVVSTSGRPVEGAEVSLRSVPDRLPLGVGYSDGDGRFRIDELPPSTVAVVACLDETCSPVATVNIDRQQAEVTLTLSVGVGLQLVVREPDGRFASRLEVTAVTDGGQGLKLDPFSASCASYGLCTVEELDSGFYSLLLRSWQGAALLLIEVPSEVIEVQLWQMSELEVHLAPHVEQTGTMVRVSDGAGAVVPPATGSDPWQPVPGVLRLELPTGDYLVELHTGGETFAPVLVYLPPEEKIILTIGPDRAEIEEAAVLLAIGDPQQEGTAHGQSQPEQQNRESTAHGVSQLPDQHSGDLSHEIMAMFITRMISYLEWPSRAFANDHSQFTVCVLGQDPFGIILDRALDRRGTKDRPHIVSRLTSREQAVRYHLLFVSRSEAENLEQIIRSVGNRPVATFSDIPGFAEAGGMVEFVSEGENVRFKISSESAQRAGIKIAPRLLALAVQR